MLFLECHQSPKIVAIILFYYPASNVLCLKVWRGMDIGAPFYHSMHFSFGVGSSLAPLIAAPFLSHLNDNGVLTESHVQTLFAYASIPGIFMSIAFLVFPCCYPQILEIVTSNVEEYIPEGNLYHLP